MTRGPVAVFCCAALGAYYPPNAATLHLGRYALRQWRGRLSLDWSAIGASWQRVVAEPATDSRILVTTLGRPWLLESGVWVRPTPRGLPRFDHRPYR